MPCHATTVWATPVRISTRHGNGGCTTHRKANFLRQNGKKRKERVKLYNVNFLADADHTKDAEDLRKGTERRRSVKGQDLGTWPPASSENSHGHESPHVPTPRPLRSLALGGKPIRTNCTSPIQKGLRCTEVPHRPQPPDPMSRCPPPQGKAAMGNGVSLNTGKTEASAAHSSAAIKAGRQAGHDMNGGGGM